MFNAAGRKMRDPSIEDVRATLVSRPKSCVALNPEDRNTRKPAIIMEVVSTIARPAVRSVVYIERT
jgi:hypothetical protein